MCDASKLLDLDQGYLESIERNMLAVGTLWGSHRRLNLLQEREQHAKRN